MEYSSLTQWILDNGVSEQTLRLLVAMTVVATIVSISRYILGSKSYGIYTPIILAIAYSYTGLRYGLVITTIVILTSLIFYPILKRIRMHYITRIAINYCLIAITMIISITCINRYGFGLENISLIPPLALISIATLSDFFIKQLVQKPSKVAFSTMFSTIVVAAIGWYIITRETISTYIINNLWIIPLFILINLLLGQFKGLRLNEIFRFKPATSDKTNVSK